MAIHNVNRRTALAALGALAGASSWPRWSQAAQPAQAWHSSYAPYNGPVKAPLASGPLPIQGRWPSELRGTLYRVGPARRELGGVSMTHWFDGDGMVQAFRFDQGRVLHKGVMLATPKLKTEEAAGRLLYSGFAQRLPNAPAVSGPDFVNPANINLLSMAGSGELFALWEGGSALAIDPSTLQAKGFKVWSGQTQGAPFSAHPRVAPDGSVWSFGYMPGSGRLLIYEIGAEGQLRRQHVLAAEQADMVHDFAITERHLVFLLMPMKFDGRLAEGNLLAGYRWQSEAPLIALLVNKSDFSVQRFEVAATGVFHLANAWEQGGCVHIRFVAQRAILSAMHRMHLPKATDLEQHAQTQLNPRARAQFTPNTQWAHITLTPATGRAELQLQGPDAVEFPRVHPARNGLPTQFTTLIARSDQMSPQVSGFDTVMTLHRDKPSHYRYGDGWIAEEHVYVPAPNDPREGRGWLLGTAYHWPSERSALSVFDAAAVRAGPIAQAMLPYGLPLGLHGQFVAA